MMSQKENFIIVAYFTRGSIYEDHVKNLVQSLKVFNLPYEVVPITNRGNWYKNMQYKPTFLRQMLEKYSPYSIVYVDADAVFYRYPDFFNELERDLTDVDIAVHVLDHSKRGRKKCAPELLSGTIFVRNSKNSSIILREWVNECRRDPNLWDQRALATVLQRHPFYELPEEYCAIFDYMRDVKNPVIKHFQASREVRAQEKKKVRRKPRVVICNGVVKIGRIHK